MGTQLRKFEKLEKRHAQESSSKVGLLSFPLWETIYKHPFPTSYNLTAGGKKNEGFVLNLFETINPETDQLAKYLYKYVTQKYPQWFDKVRRAHMSN